MSWECPCDYLEEELEEAQDKVDELEERVEDLERQLESLGQAFETFIYATIRDDDFREFMKEFKDTKFQNWLYYVLPEELNYDEDYILQIARVIVKDQTGSLPKSKSLFLSILKGLLTPKQYKIFKERWEDYGQNY